MIRTKIVELSTIEAVAYRRKLKRGHSGVVVMRYDTEQPGLASLNRSTGEPDIAQHIDQDLYPAAAFQEALELTSGLPYSSRGSVKLNSAPAPDDEDDDDADDIATVDSVDYEAIVKEYTNRKGELSYELLNRDFIQFAKSSRVVSDLVGNLALEDEIRNHIVRAKFEAITKNRDITDAQIGRIVEMLDEVSPRGVFRELNSELRKLLSRS